MRGKGVYGATLTNEHSGAAYHVCQASDLPRQHLTENDTPTSAMQSHPYMLVITRLRLLAYCRQDC